MEEEKEVVLQAHNTTIIKDLILEKKGKTLGKQTIRRVEIIDGKIKQKSGSGGGGCMAGPAGREYSGITKVTLQEKDQFKASWNLDTASHKNVRYEIEFKNRGNVYIYFENKKEAETFASAVGIPDSGKVSNGRNLTQKSVKGGYNTNGYKVKQDRFTAFKLFGGQQQQQQQQPSNNYNQWSEVKHDKNNMLASVIKPQNYRSPYQQALDQAAGGQFVDQSFPHNLNSLTYNPGQFPIANKVEWKRASEFLESSKLKVFEGKIEPNDIKQGQLGDCYFLCSLSALAERDNLITKLFITKEIQQNGIYCVFICIDGEFQEIVLDDYFPTQNGQPAFSRANGPELWVLLLEKAYAKVYGNYHNIEAGLTGLALRDLTGAPHEWVSTSEGPEKVWEFIKYHDNPAQGHIMTAGSQAGATRKEIDMGQGIVTGHAYAILDHKTVQTNRGTENIIQLRNPWGSKEWQGRWSDKSDAWTPQLKQECGVKDADDGLFWIEVRDFSQQFSEVTTNMLQENYIYTSQRVPMQNKNQILVKFYVREETQGYIQVSQRDKRHYEGKNQNYEYSYMSLIICKSDFTEYIGDEFSNYRDFYVNGQFTPGEYYAYIDVQWSPNRLDASDFVISAYTSNQVQFNPQTVDDTNTIVDQMLTLKSPVAPEKVKHYDDDPSITRFYQAAGSFLYFCYSNNSEESTINETVRLKSHDYLVICPPEQNSDEFKVKVGPQSCKVIKYKLQAEGHGGYSLALGYSTSISLGQQQLVNQLLQTQPKQRKVGGQFTNVNVYTLFNSQGLFFYYLNKDSRTYKEDITLKLTNLKVEPDGVNQQSIVLQPGESKLIKCSLVNPNVGVGYACSMLCSFQ